MTAGYAVGKSNSGLSIRRIPGHLADYVRLDGVIDGSFGAERIGDLTRPTAIDLLGVTHLSADGIQAWVRTLRAVPSSVPIYLVNVPMCITEMLVQVPNAGAHAHVVTLAVPGKCARCGRDKTVTIDLLAKSSNTSPGNRTLDCCPHCGGILETPAIDISTISREYSARNVPSELAPLLEGLGVYKTRKSDTDKKPFAIAKLVEGNVNLLRLKGTFDERIRPQRILSGLEGALLIDVKELEVSPDGMRRWRELVDALAQSPSPVVLVHLPHTLIERSEEAGFDLARLCVDSVVVPCYCATCDDMRVLPIATAELAGPEPQGQCPRCGRPASMVSGVLALDQLVPRLRPTPADLVPTLKRFDEIFSMAAVEAKLITSSPSTSGSSSGARPASDQIGPYKVLRPLAKGGMAEVFLAVRDGGYSKPVALKLFRRELLTQTRKSVTMFLREARLSAKLNHPNIVQVFDVGEADGNLFLVMEYLEGINADELVLRHGQPFPPAIAICIITQVLRALEYAHGVKDHDGTPLNIVHRDVSLMNIIIGPDGHLKLIDFGIAISGSTADVLAGNPGYMSPEQLTGAPLDGRSDIFSAGIVLYELLAGGRLFRGNTGPQPSWKIQRGIVPELTNIPAALQKVLARSYHPEREQRFQSAGEFITALRGVAHDVGGEASQHDLRVFLSTALAARSVAKTPSGPVAVNTQPATPSSKSGSGAAPPSSRSGSGAVPPPRASAPSAPIATGAPAPAEVVEPSAASPPVPAAPEPKRPPNRLRTTLVIVLLVVVVGVLGWLAVAPLFE